MDNEIEDPEILKFVEKQEKDEEPDGLETLFKMGDFSIFTDFLKVLIGAEKNIENDKE